MLYSLNILIEGQEEYFAIGRTPVIYASSTHGLSFSSFCKLIYWHYVI